MRTRIIALFWSIFLVFPAFGQATEPTYRLFVIAEDVQIQYVNGELRFCQRRNMKGRLCGEYHKLFGKERFLVMDWWSPETYARAASGIEKLVVTDVSPDPRGQSLLIYFKQVN